MKTYTIKFLSIIALLGIAIHSSAQEEANVNREMTLEREYNPSVQDANKVNTLPTVKEPVIRKIPIDYATFTTPASPGKEVSILPSGKVQTDMEYNKRRGYLNLAGGTLMNLNSDFGYHFLSTEKDQLNFEFSHRSTDGKIKYLQIDEKVKAKLNDHALGLNYRHAFDNAIFKIGAKYGFSIFNYYGYAASIPTISTILTPDLKTKQKAQTIQFHTGVASHKDAPVEYLLDMDYTNFSYKYGLSKEYDGPTEHTIGVKGGVGVLFDTDQRLGADASVRYFNYNIPSDYSFSHAYNEDAIFDNYAEITLSPYYRIHGDSWKVQLGANIMYITGDNDKFMITPNVDITAGIADKTEFYVSATGKIQSNSLYDVSQINRYSNPSVGILPTQHWLNSTIGIRSGVLPGFWFDIFGGYNIMKNDLLFATNYVFLQDGFGNYSYALHDMDVNHFFVGANLKYSYQKFIDFSLKGVFNNWDVDTEDGFEDPKAYGRPKVEFTAGIDIHPINNLSIAFDYYIGTDRYAYTEGGTYTMSPKIIKLDNISELNATVSYALSDKFGAYVKLNNLLFQKYEWQYGYPMQKFSAMVGFNLNF